MQKTTIILVRHCEAQGNIDRVFQGHLNGKTTENGQAQLGYLAKRMKEFPFDYLYSSPLSRAVETARACNTLYHKPIHIIKGVIEIFGGEWEGKKFASFPTEFPEEARRWNSEPWGFVAPNGESMEELYCRMRDTITSIAKRHPGKRVCVASHGCAIRSFLCFAKGWELGQLAQVGWCDNTGISLIEFDEDFVPTLVFENDSAHLSDEHSTLAKQSWWKQQSADLSNFDE